jgi:hypothetical protein
MGEWYAPSGPLLSAALAQALSRVAARAQDAGLSRQRLATQHERLRMVGRELAGSDNVWLAMPARPAETARTSPGWTSHIEALRGP